MKEKDIRRKLDLLKEKMRETQKRDLLMIIYLICLSEGFLEWPLQLEFRKFCVGLLGSDEYIQEKLEERAQRA